MDTITFKAITSDDTIETYTLRNNNNKWEAIKKQEVIFSHDKFGDCMFWLNHNELSEIVCYL